MSQERNYQRKHLRAPFKMEILYTAENKVYKAGGVNLSEEGILMTSQGHLPSTHKKNYALLQIPQYPFFKNFTLEKLKTYSSDLLPCRFAKLTFEVLRTFADSASGARSMGTRITDIEGRDLLVIRSYISVFSSNLIFLLVLIDSLDTDQTNLERVRILSRLLGYDNELKMALLRKQLEVDYQSLQWG